MANSSTQESDLIPCGICNLNRTQSRKYNWIKCIGCQPGRYHLSCVGLTKREKEALPNWKCASCLGRDPVSLSTPAGSLQPSSVVPDDLSLELAQLKSRIKLLKRIPKSARIAVAEALCPRIEAVLSEASPESWWRFLSFSYSALRAPTEGKGEGGSLASHIKRQIASDGIIPEEIPIAGEVAQDKSDPLSKLSIRVQSKCADGDMKAALRLLTSDDSLLSPTQDIIGELRAKHPPAPIDQAIPSSLPNESTNPLSVDRDQVYKAVTSMASGSAGGIDGIRPLFLKQLLAQETAAAGQRLLDALTRLVNATLSGAIPDFARRAYFGASLFALRKKDGGIRPIAVGSAYRRLAGRIAAHHASSLVSAHLMPVQLGVGVKHGCEAAVHATREYISLQAHLDSSQQVLVKIDVQNAFNCVRRDKLLEQIRVRCPEIYCLAWQSYHSPTPLYIGETSIESCSGVQQGDPLGPLAFALAIDGCARPVQSPLNLWYLDDGTIAGPADMVAQDLSRLCTALADIGLTLNQQKCEVAYLGLPDSELGDRAISTIKSVLPSIKTMSVNTLELLGSPLLDEKIGESIDRVGGTISDMCHRLKLLDPHTGFFFLCNYASYSRFLYLLRTSPTYKSPNHLDRIDEVFQETLVSNHERRHPRRCLDPGNPPSEAWRPRPSSFVCSRSSLLPFIPYILL